MQIYTSFCAADLFNAASYSRKLSAQSVGLPGAWLGTVKGEGAVPLVVNYATPHEDVWGSGGIVPRVRNLNIG
jgi:hypothetical protein